MSLARRYVGVGRLSVAIVHPGCTLAEPHSLSQKLHANITLKTQASIDMSSKYYREDYLQGTLDLPDCLVLYSIILRRSIVGVTQLQSNSFSH